MPPAFTPVALEHASRLINHGPTVLVTAAHGGRRNLMAAAWSMPVEFSPPRIAIVIDKNTFTRELIAASGTFGVCIPGAALADLTFAVGSCSGRDGDKFAAAGLGRFAAARIAAPLLAGCAAWLECRVLPEPHNARRYDLFIAEVLAAHADPALFSDGAWHFPDAERTTLHYQSGGRFFATGEAFAVPSAER